ncbi:MAG: CmcJ/NvfI family oxidoreductase [Candidatus Binatia bacterium]
MTQSATSVTDREASMGRLNYLASSAPSSLYRNGKMLLRRNADGSDSELEGVVFDERQVMVHNARLLKGDQRRTVEKNGFELFFRPLAHPDLDFLDHQDVIQYYYRECEQLVQEVTGAATVVAFDHNVRSTDGKQSKQRIRGGQAVQGPARMAHGDYTLTSAPERLQRLAQEPCGNDTLRSVIAPGKSLLDPAEVEQAIGENGRFAIINVWRNIADEPVATHALALCDAQTVTPKDLSVFELHYADRVGENYFSKQAPGHEWYYYPAMTRDEAVLIKQWDSAGPLAQSKGQQPDSDDPQAPCTFSFHSSFDDASTLPNAPARWSIEVRCVVIYR